MVDGQVLPFFCQSGCHLRLFSLFRFDIAMLKEFGHRLLKHLFYIYKLWTETECFHIAK